MPKTIVGQLLEMASFIHKNPVLFPHPNLLQRVIHRTTDIIEDPLPNNSNRCLCEVISPVFHLSQLFGIAPARFIHTFSSQKEDSTRKLLRGANNNEHVTVNIAHHSTNSNLESKRNYSCNLNTKWLSIPSIINIIFLINFITISVWVFQNLKVVLKIYFHGTDLVTFGLQVQLLYLQACGILMNAILKRKKLQRVWSLIQDVYKNRICTGKSQIHQNFGRLRKFNYFLVGVTCCTGALFATYFVHFVFRWCFYNVETAVEEMRSGNQGVGGRNDSELLKVKPPCPFSDGFLFLQKLCYTLLIFYNMGFASLFSGFCAILWLLFKDIGFNLRQVLKNPSEDNATTWIHHHNHSTKTTNKAEQLEKLRIEHETLCKASRILGDCLGISVLIVCVSSLLSITCGIYTTALRMGIFNPNQEESTFSMVSGFYVLSTVHGVIAVLVLMLILVSGQIVQNAASKPAEIISNASHLGLNMEEKHQISVFLHKVGTSSTEIRACNVTTIGLGFLAAAATNVTTYILVILQFRLGVEPQAEADQQQQQHFKTF